MSNFKTSMQDISDAFERRSRDNGDLFYALKEGSPTWTTETIHAAHKALDGRLPDDWVYEAVASLASNYNVCNDADEARDQEHEVCDGLVDTYTSDLTSWLASSIHNVTLCDEVAEEFDAEADGLTRRIANGQLLAYQRVSSAVIEAVESEAETRDNDTTEVYSVIHDGKVIHCVEKTEEAHKCQPS
jgi:hypothetical protein